MSERFKNALKQKKILLSDGAWGTMLFEKGLSTGDSPESWNLSNEHVIGDIAKLYGIFREEDGFSERANIIINEDGKIEFIKIYEIGTLPEIKEILTLLGKPNKKEIIQP